MTGPVRARALALVASVLVLGALIPAATAQPAEDPPAESEAGESEGGESEAGESEAAESEAGASEDPEDPGSDSNADPTNEGEPAAPPETAPKQTDTATGAASRPASPIEQARSQAIAGREFYQQGNYVAALEAFQAAFVLNPTAGLAYNVARSHEGLSQWKEAIAWYERYVELEPDPRQRANVLDKIDLLRTRVGGDAAEDQFEARMVSGKRAYARGDFEGAVEDFKAAFDVRPEASALYNIAKSYEKMARYEDALDYYQQYLDLDPNASDRANVVDIMARLRRDLRARFQELSVASDPPGADVYIDDRNEGIIGQTNLQTKLRPGAHILFIDRNGFEPIRREFVMSDDKPLALEFTLVPLENVGYVKINVDRPGARIFVDGAIVGLSPFTQKKALEAGEHQIQVELVGYDRYVDSFVVERDATNDLSVNLKKYSPPISDGTLDDWGRNLVLFGLVGGGLGFGGPILYQEVILGRPYFEDLGPDNREGRPFYEGPGRGTQDNDELDTLRTVQTVSLIAGGVLVASGLAVYMYKWFRTVPPPPVTAQSAPADRPLIEVTGIGIAPTPDGGSTIGITGRF